MKKRGFTLIELLAVIVILAIIALIATPVVMNMIENSKKGAALRSAERYMNAVETAVGTERIDGVVLEGEYTIQSDGNLCKKGETCTDDTEIKVDMSGNKPNDGTIVISNGAVTTDSTMIVGEYNVSYDAEEKKLIAHDSILIESVNVDYSHCIQTSGNTKSLISGCVPVVTIEPANAMNKKIEFSFASDTFSNCGKKYNISDYVLINSETGAITKLKDFTHVGGGSSLKINLKTLDGSNISVDKSVVLYVSGYTCTY